jgi:type IV secretory pathway VirB2 component (pilin)
MSSQKEMVKQRLHEKLERECGATIGSLHLTFRSSRPDFRPSINIRRHTLKLKFPSLRRLAPVLVALSLPWSVAFAQALPWESPLTKLQTSLTGPVARAIGVIALAAAGGMLAFGGELGDFTKRILMVVLALSVLILANQFMSIIG